MGPDPSADRGGEEELRTYRVPPRPSFPGSEVLIGRSPRAVLDRLLDGDPLDLASHVEARLLERAYFVSFDRVVKRTAARLAYAAMAYRGEPPLADWIAIAIDQSLEELLCEDIEAERRGIPPASPWDPDFAMFTEIAGVEPGQARSMCVAFNALPEEVRRTVYAVLVERKSFNRWVAEGHGPPERAKAMLKRGMLALLLMHDPDSEPMEQEELDEALGPDPEDEELEEER